MKGGEIVRTYVKPVMEVVELRAEERLAGSFTVTINGTTSTFSGDINPSNDFSSWLSSNSTLLNWLFNFFK